MDDPGAEAALPGFSGVLSRIDQQHRFSMTYDEGKEMTRHQELPQQTGIQVYFAAPYSPWQRSINENTNGLLRQYLSKGDDLSRYSQDDLDTIARSFNTRPSKSLGWKCPAELLPRCTSNLKPPSISENSAHVFRTDLESLSRRPRAGGGLTSP
jgi:transposase, IS30 family